VTYARRVAEFACRAGDFTYDGIEALIRSVLEDAAREAEGLTLDKEIETGATLGTVAPDRIARGACLSIREAKKAVKRSARRVSQLVVAVTPAPFTGTA